MLRGEWATVPHGECRLNELDPEQVNERKTSIVMVHCTSRIDAPL